MKDLIKLCNNNNIKDFIRQLKILEYSKLSYNIIDKINKYLYNFEKTMPICLLIAIDNENIELIKYIITNYSKYIDLFGYNYYDQLFEIAYNKDNLEIFDLLIKESNYKFDIHYDNEKYFRNACNIYGHIKWIKYLYKLSLKMNSPINYNIISNNETPFINAVSFYGYTMNNNNNSWEVIKYLIKISNGNIKHNINSKEDLYEYNINHRKYLRNKLNLEF